MIVTGETGRFDGHGLENKKNAIFDLLKIPGTDRKLISDEKGKKFIYYPECPGKVYSKNTRDEFDRAAWSGSWEKTNFFSLLNTFKSDISGHFGLDPKITIEASPFISTQLAMVEGSRIFSWRIFRD
jgi:hypothetical protein